MCAKGLYCSWQTLAHQFFWKSGGYSRTGPVAGVDAYPAAVSSSWNKPTCLPLAWRTWLQIIKSLLSLCWLRVLESKAGYLGCSFAYQWGNARLSWLLHLQRFSPDSLITWAYTGSPANTSLLPTREQDISMAWTCLSALPRQPQSQHHSCFIKPLWCTALHACQIKL